MAEDLPDAPWAKPADLPDAPWAAADSAEPAGVPKPFMDRVIRGDALKRALSGFTAAAKGFSEGFGSEPLGMSEEHVHQLQELGIYRDPATGRGGAIRLANEAVLQPAAVLGDLALRSVSGGVHAIGAAIGQMFEEAELPMASRAKNEAINFLNYQLMRGDHGRVDHSPAGPLDRTVGRLPTEADFKASAAVLGGDAAEANLRRAWTEDGIHPAELVHDAQTDAFLRKVLTEIERDPAVKLPPDAWSPEALAEKPYELPAEPPLRAVGAEVTGDMPSLAEQPPPAPGRVAAAFQSAAEKLHDIGRDAQMLVAPMATGTRDSMALAKDFANALRRNRWEWARIDDDIAKRFTPEQRKRMWDAADEESVARQLGESREHQGLVTLEAGERAAVEDLQARAQTAWLRARDLGMVEGEGLPAYTPRMLMNVSIGSDRGGPIPLNGIGLNLRTKTGQMSKRQYLTAEETEAAAKRLVGMRAAKQLRSLDEINALVDDVRIARDIRALPLATAKLEDAIAGRTLINNIKDYGARTGAETVSEGAKPPAEDWFTLDHPAFRTWRPKLKEKAGGGFEAVKDAEGNTLFEQVPIYVHGDFEGPLKAVLSHRSGALYGTMMSLKGKTMSLIMNSPIIHNAVEWGRALFAMPGKVATFKVYFEGNRAKNNIPLMREAIDNGLVPIGKRFFNQDITSIMEAPDLTPGRSWTAKVLGAVPGLFDEAAGNAVKAAIDKAGDFWHNTLLWDRVADLQMGLYVNFRDGMVAKGVDRQTASRAAAHWANRYAGALPQEAMSDGARKIANMMLFSRSFTLGNIGVMKDMLNGLPRDVMAQISRDVGQLDPNAAGYIRSLAKRKAVAIVMLDMVGMYVLNSLFQSTMNVLATDRTLDEEMHGYAQRLTETLSAVGEHPLKLLQPFELMGRLGATAENEPGRQERVRVGSTKDGTAIYARSPVGKIGEEFEGYLTGPLDMMRKKLGTVARPAWAIMTNDQGFGRKVYDPNADTPAKYLKNMGLIVAHIAKSQIPEGQFSAVSDLVKGEGDQKLAALQAFGPFAGVTFSKGAPGGPAVGELYYARQQHDYAVQAALPDIRKQIQRGDIEGAQQRMTDLGIPAGLQKYYVKTTINPALRLGPRAVKDLYLYGTEEQKARFERAR